MERTTGGDGRLCKYSRKLGGRREGIFSTLLFFFSLFLFPQISVFDPGNSEEVPGTVYTCCTAVRMKTVNQS